MENVSALLALCEGNPSATHKTPGMSNFDISIVVSLNKILHKQSSYWLFVTPSRSCDVTVMYYIWKTSFLSI